MNPNFKIEININRVPIQTPIALFVPYNGPGLVKCRLCQYKPVREYNNICIDCSRNQIINRINIQKYTYYTNDGNVYFSDYSPCINCKAKPRNLGDDFCGNACAIIFSSHRICVKCKHRERNPCYEPCCSLNCKERLFN